MLRALARYRLQTGNPARHRTAREVEIHEWNVKDIPLCPDLYSSTRFDGDLPQSVGNSSSTSSTVMKSTVEMSGVLNTALKSRLSRTDYLGNSNCSWVTNMECIDLKYLNTAFTQNAVFVGRLCVRLFVRPYVSRSTSEITYVELQSAEPFGRAISDAALLSQNSEHHFDLGLRTD